MWVSWLAAQVCVQGPIPEFDMSSISMVDFPHFQTYYNKSAHVFLITKEPSHVTVHMCRVVTVHMGRVVTVSDGDDSAETKKEQQD